jgi:hypothetical protein
VTFPKNWSVTSAQSTVSPPSGHQLLEEPAQEDRALGSEHGGVLTLDPGHAVQGPVCLGILLQFLVLGLFAGLEFLLVLLVLPFAVLGRMLFGRHWHVELRRGFTPWWEVEAGDWQASSVWIHQVADAVRRGVLPERTLSVD